MANYTFEQAYKMIDDCYTPEYLMMEKTIERQRYIDIFTEMHNYISENIIELPFDAEVFTEEDDNVERKSVWDKNKKGWSGFWENVWAVIKNIWNNFWRFIRAIGSYNDTIKPQEAQKIADKAEEVAKDLEQKSEQEVQKAVEEKKEVVKETFTDISQVVDLLQKSFTKLEEIDDKAANAETKARNTYKAGSKSLDRRIKEIKQTKKENIKKVKDKIKSIVETLSNDPTQFKDSKSLLVSLLKQIAGKFNPSKVEAENKLINAIRSLLVATMIDGKLIFKVLSLYSSQGDTVKTALQTFFDPNSGGGFSDIINYFSQAINKASLYITDKVNTYFTTLSAVNPAFPGAKAGDKVVDTGELTNMISDVTKVIGDIQTGLDQMINSFNITALNRDDYKIDFDSSSGLIKNINYDSLKKFDDIKDIPADLYSIDNDIRTKITSIVNMSGECVSYLVLIKQIDDRKIGTLLNNAINKLSSL